MKSLVLGISILALLTLPLCSQEASHAAAFRNLMTLSQAIDSKVITVTKQKERLFSTDAAVSVVSREDLRRFGARTIQDALRMVPGVSSRSADNGKGIIRSRGAYDRFQNSILVLVDGRSMFNETFYGVLWETIDLPIEEIERIEIIRGPAGSLWGANAVDGIINIITRNPMENEKGEVSLTLDQHGGGRLYGSTTTRFNDDLLGRFHLQGRHLEPRGSEIDDELNSLRGGMELQWTPSLTDLFKVSAGAYEARPKEQVLQASLTPPYQEARAGTAVYTGGHLHMQWDHHMDATSSSTIRLYGLSHKLDTDYTGFSERLADLEWIFNKKLGDRQRLNLGLGYRFNESSADPNDLFVFEDNTLSVHSFNGFFQDRIELLDDELWLTLGGKVEHNRQIDTQIQPSARVLYSPEEDITVWGAISRSVRTPGRIEYGSDLVIGARPPPTADSPPILIVLDGNEGAEEERSVAWETGVRKLFEDKALLDLSLFFNDYDNLTSFEMQGLEPGLRAGVPVIEARQRIENNLEAESYGAELTAEIVLSEKWQLGGTYTHHQIDASADEGSTDEFGLSRLNVVPENEVLLHLGYSHSERLQLDSWLEYSDELDEIGIDAITRLRLRAGYEATPKWSLDFVVENLLNDGEIEFSTNKDVVPTSSTAPETTVFIQSRYRF